MHFSRVDRRSRPDGSPFGSPTVPQAPSGPPAAAGPRGAGPAFSLGLSVRVLRL